jgi:hypothetical protein
MVLAILRKAATEDGMHSKRPEEATADALTLNRLSVCTGPQKKASTVIDIERVLGKVQVLSNSEHLEWAASYRPVHFGSTYRFT